jgi:hypothetical protein
MNEQFSNSTISHKEMQELLPDYIFGRLDIEDQIVFENSLPAYPDIRQEVEDGRTVFGKLELMDIDRLLAQRTRNLSVKVNQRLSKKPRHFERFSWSLRYAVPSFGLIILVLIIFWGKDIFLSNASLNQNVIDKTSEMNVIDEFHIFTQNDAAILFDNSIKQKEFNNLSESMINPDYHVTLAEGIQFENHVDNIVDNYYVNNHNLVKSAKSYSKIYSQFTSTDLIDEISQLDEDEFQNILKELENADINS